MEPYSADELIALRRDLHRHPELSHMEERTAAIVAERLRGLGLPVETEIAGHGVVALLEGERDGPTLLYRADMDALPIQEVDGRAYGSEVPGVMHACGHDVHTTIGLGVAAELVAQRSELHGAVKFVFQPAEEAVSPDDAAIGAERMVEEGVLESPDVDAAFALHVMPSLEVGKLGHTGGPVWAASDRFELVVEGQMSHGAYPHEGRDVIAAGASIVHAFQTAAARAVDVRDPAVISVCRFVAGSSHNILPERAELHGLVRSLDGQTRALIFREMERVAQAVAEAHGCRARIRFDRGAHATVNDLPLEALAGDAIRAALGDEAWVPFPPQMGAEDFSAFSRRVPSCYLFLGVRNEERGIVHMIHTPEFDVDEACIALGVRAMAATLTRAASTWSPPPREAG